MRSRVRRDHVFINCPFDQGYRAILDGIVFAIYDLGFVALCALEDDDGGEIRLSKIERIIEECGFGIHDLSAVAIDPATNLPRFNMPLELGLFLGCKRFGDEPQRKKKCLILDNDRYRYRNFISDVAGQDIHAHGGQAREAIIEVRNWLPVPREENSCRAVPKSRLDTRDFRPISPLCARVHRDPANLISLTFRRWYRSG